MKNKSKLLFMAVLLAAAAAIFVFSERTMKIQKLDHYTKIDLSAVPAEKWKALAEKTVFFGHMSVGYNIIDGVADILKQTPSTAISLREIKMPSEASARVFCHAAIGHNGDPVAKLNAFADFVKAMQPAPDIAFMKFCYVDFYAASDLKAVTEAYRSMIVNLQRECPETAFFHCTVPLTARPFQFKRQIKEAAKSFLGRPVTADDNAKRQAFSQWLHQTYPVETIIDVARAESVSADGILLHKTRKGQPIPFLWNDYTTDGGHLNETGRSRVAHAVVAGLLNAVD